MYQGIYFFLFVLHGFTDLLEAVEWYLLTFLENSQKLSLQIFRDLLWYFSSIFSANLEKPIHWYY
jgi:hypothetical protein